MRNTRKTRCRYEVRFLQQGTFGAQSGTDHLRLHTPRYCRLFCPVRGGMAWNEDWQGNRQSSRYRQTEGQKARRWKIMIWKALAIAAAVLLCLCYAAHSHTNDGTWDDTPYKAWYEKQHNKNGTNCCDWGDAFATEYTVRGGKFFVIIHGKEYQVPDYAVIEGSNPTGHSVVWYYLEDDSTAHIRCFSPVSAT